MPEKLEIPTWLRAGVYLHTSCNNEWWGPVKRVGEDPNGRQVLDFELDSRQLHYFITTPDENPEIAPNLCRVAVPDGKCLMRDAPVTRISDYGDGTRFITLATPGDGCFRCTQLFSVHEVKP